MHREPAHLARGRLDSPPRAKKKETFMENKSDPHTWQELLQQLTEDPKEKERILQQANIQPVTLTRWIKGVCSPRADNMRSLLKAIPLSSVQTFTQLLTKDFPNLLSEQTRKESIRSEPPVEFY